jgi:Raf kinase inhibitor-like YbhB/YbcL family protein
MLGTRMPRRIEIRPRAGPARSGAGRVDVLERRFVRRRLEGRAFALGLAALLASAAAAAEGDRKGSPSAAFILESPSFSHQGQIPTRFTCEGADLSPALSWSGVPDGTRSLALIVDDPDAPDPRAPKVRWVHWVLYNLPPAPAGLPEGVAEEMLPEGARPGLNDWKRTGYGGPCPPIGRHRYFFDLYALDAVLPDLEEPTRAELERAMEGHVLGVAELIGTYQKRR